MPSDFAKNLCAEFVKAYKFEGPVLDVGSGDVSYWYKPSFEGFQYLTADPLPSLSSIVDYNVDVCNLPRDLKDSFGVVLMLESLEHIANPFCAFKSCFRILKPGGFLLCSTVACYGIHKHPADFWRFLPDGLELLMLQAGFLNKGVKMNQPNTTRTAHICCVAQKPEKKVETAAV